MTAVGNKTFQHLDASNFQHLLRSRDSLVADHGIHARNAVRGLILDFGRSRMQEISAQMAGDLILVQMPEEAELAQKLPPQRLGCYRSGWAEISDTYLGQRDHPTATLWIVYRTSRLDPLPPFMTFDGYDIGHEVVVVEGELMGSRGKIRSMNGSSVTLERGITHRVECVAVIRTGNAEADFALAPLLDRLPPGSPAWMHVEGEWEKAVIGGYSGDVVEAWLVKRKMPYRTARSRVLIRERTGSKPPGLLRTAPGATDRNVPGARSFAERHKARGLRDQAVTYTWSGQLVDFDGGDGTFRMDHFEIQGQRADRIVLDEVAGIEAHRMAREFRLEEALTAGGFADQIKQLYEQRPMPGGPPRPGSVPRPHITYRVPGIPETFGPFNITEA